MSRRIRHVHARPGEHIYVHRHDHPRRPRTPRPAPVARYTPSYASSYVAAPAYRSTYTPPSTYSFWEDVPWWVYVGGALFVGWILFQIPVRIYVIAASVAVGVPLAVLAAWGIGRLSVRAWKKWRALPAERRRKCRRAAWWTMLVLSLAALFVLFPVESFCVSAVVAAAGLLVRRHRRRRRSAAAPMLSAPEAPQAGEEASAASSLAAETA